MELVLTESIGAIARWLHVIAGIAWIGSSFYFIHLDLSLQAATRAAGGVRVKRGRSTAAASTT